MLLKPIQVTAPIWAPKHYVWATRFQFLVAQVTTKALKSVCSTDHQRVNLVMNDNFLMLIFADC